MCTCNFLNSKLANRMSVYSIFLPNTHSVVLSLYVKAGIMYEDKEHTGVSHLIEHLLFRRLHDIDQRQLYYEMECMGTTLRAATHTDFIRFYIEVLPKYASRAFDLLYKLLLEPNWTAEDIRLEKAVVLNQIQERSFTYNDQNKLDYWKGTPLSNLIMGSESKVKALSRRTILSYYNLFFQPQNCCFVASGNIGNDQVEDMHKRLECLKNSGEDLPNHQIFPNKFSARSEKDDFCYHTDYDYADVKICFDVNYDEILPELAEYLHSILDGLGSRLSIVLREELCLVDDVFTEFQRHNGFSILTISYDVISEKLIESIDEVFNIIQDLKETITNKDINASLPFLSDNWELFYDSPEDLNFHYGFRSYVLGEPFTPINKVASKFMEITIDQLKAAASKLFVSKNMTSFVYCNKEIHKVSQVKKCLAQCRGHLN